MRNQFAGTVHELVDSSRRASGTTTPGRPSHDAARHDLAYAADRILLSQTLTLDASLRTGDATVRKGPRQRELAESHTRRICAGSSPTGADRARGRVRRSANTLTLNWLAYGDPAAPVAKSRARGRVLVARVGPGTGGNSSFSRIDDGLRRPYTDELSSASSLAAAGRYDSR